MDNVLFVIADFPVTLATAIAAGVALMALLLVIGLVATMQASRIRAEEAQAALARSAEMERHLASLMQVQSEMTGRMQTMSEIFGSRTSDLARLVNERLDSTSQRVGQA